MTRPSWLLIAALFGAATLFASPTHASAPVPKHEPWIHRWAPERHTLEIGGFVGSFFPSLAHDLYNPATGYKPLWLANGEAGLRCAYFPESFLEVELEGAFIPARVRTLANEPVSLWAARGHVIVQLPWWSVAPFVLVGAGGMGVRSDPGILGGDIDPAVHWGGGLRVRVHRNVNLRLDGRHVLSARHATRRSFTSHAELLAGVVITFSPPRTR